MYVLFKPTAERIIKLKETKLHLQILEGYNINHLTRLIGLCKEMMNPLYERRPSLALFEWMV